MPFCDTPQVNQLTALLASHHVRNVVVCPGSRNAVIVHNLHELPEQFVLTPVTDERSAAFVALGIALATQEIVAVCVTSGSALLNCLPAVAEAYYRHLPLLVISADRPKQWIGQGDGQTLPQEGALLPYCPTFAIATPHTEEDGWMNNRCINEALLSLNDNGGRPAHINVAIEEPMFSFTTPALPNERRVARISPPNSQPLPDEVVRIIANAALPALLIGQYERGDIRSEVESLNSNAQMLVLPEVISDVSGSFRMNAFDKMVEDCVYVLPDVVVQIGGNFVHKRFKETLRRRDVTVIRVGEDDGLIDTFRHLSYQIHTSPQAALAQLAAELPAENANVKAANRDLNTYWEYEEYRLNLAAADENAPIDFHYALILLQHGLQQQHPNNYTLHLANSTTVRAAAQVFEGGTVPIYCNRGVNGIEGSMSTAIGCAMKMWGLHILVIGDLSFYYDVNALWNTHLPSNLRILLMNNAHGGIFDHLPGLEQSPARDELISASSAPYSAEGVAATFGLRYHLCTSKKPLARCIEAWLRPSDCAALLEVRMA